MMDISNLNLVQVKSLAAQLMLSDVIRALQNAFGPTLDDKMRSVLERTVAMGHRIEAHDVCASGVVQGALSAIRSKTIKDMPLVPDNTLGHTGLGKLAGTIICKNSLFSYDEELDLKFWQDFIKNQGEEMIPYRLNRAWISARPENDPIGPNLTPKRVASLADIYELGGGYHAGKEYFDLIFCHAYRQTFYHLLGYLGH